DIAEDIKHQLLERIKGSPWFDLQVDESTDGINMAMALSLPKNTTGVEIFRVLDEYVSSKLNWKFCVGDCTDEAAAMTGRLSGPTTRIKAVAIECKSTYCIIHCEMLASRKLSPEINDTLRVVVRVVNHIKVNALTV
ncbi:SCND3 protein, partial [Polyodon spathula]|nr:SCND3 protein [Polyodon spathula]